MGEPWENMSTCSGNSGSIQTIKTFYGGVASPADKPDPRDSDGKWSSVRDATCGEHDGMVILDRRTQVIASDIASKSDFSDEEDVPQFG